jgi:predicted Fe-Mo cluster-binding NifX family protein
MSLPAFGKAGFKEFSRTAIPVFMGRVSPVLDTCTRFGLLEPGRNHEIIRGIIPVKGNSIYERTDEIKKLGVGVVICGAVSDAFFNLLKENGIDLVCGITGDIEEVIEAYSKGALVQARFRMPGSE